MKYLLNAQICLQDMREALPDIVHEDLVGRHLVLDGGLVEVDLLQLDPLAEVADAGDPESGLEDKM